MYVINADRFFVDYDTPHSRELKSEPDARVRYESKRGWQQLHQTVCRWIPLFCGGALSFFRQRETGEWKLAGSISLPPTGIDSELPVDLDRVARARTVARDFIETVGVDRNCVLLTYVPHKRSERATAAALAKELGVEFVSPKLSDLRTFDGSHLEPKSAERFAKAFVEAAGPSILQCIKQDDRAGSEPTPLVGLDREAS